MCCWSMVHPITRMNPFQGDLSLYWNSEAFLFARITENLGLTTTGDWRGLHVDDLDDDGDPDFVASGIGLLPRVFENRISDTGRGLVVRLRGTLSTPHGSGAYLTLRGGTNPPKRNTWVIRARPTCRVYRFRSLRGIQRENATLEIQWPSGLVSEEGDFGARLGCFGGAPYASVHSGKPDSPGRLGGSDSV